MKAPCAGMWELFDSTDLADHGVARELCATCPMRLECTQTASLLMSTTPIEGTWAGRLYGNGRTQAGSRSLGTCPLCGAQDGQRCVSPNGNKVGAPHRARSVGLPKCGSCDETFTPSKNGTRYCSKDCARDGRRASSRRHQAKRLDRTDYWAAQWAAS